jgi:2,3-bisphosphoglycerate-independent phosphoglycerate mutase
MDNGSDICCMSLLGFDPRKHHTGRAPLEAISLGIELKPGQIAVRCNTVTVKDGVMADYSAGHISTAESKPLLEALERALGKSGQHFFPGVQYRHILVLDRDPQNAALDAVCHAPHNIVGHKIEEYLPKGNDGGLLLDLMLESRKVLKDHPVNREREKRGVNTATQVWLWGHGPRPSLPTFKERFGMSGAMISAVDLLKSLGMYLGLEVLDVPGITGFTDTNYANKGIYAVNALEQHDFVFVHVEAPDECGHMGDVEQKQLAFERIDQEIISRLAHSRWARNGELRVLVCPDHSTPCALKKHGSEPIPFLCWGPGFAGQGLPYGEHAMQGTRFKVPHGFELMGKFLEARI